MATFENGALFIDHLSSKLDLQTSVSLTTRQLLLLVTESSLRVSSVLTLLYDVTSKKAFEIDRPFLDVRVVFVDRVDLDSLRILKKDRQIHYYHSERCSDKTKKILEGLKSQGRELKSLEIQKEAAENDKLFAANLTGESLTEKVGNVVIGGSFDKLHAGHKILLTVSACLASERLVIGVTDDSMLKSKKFTELIDPVGVRCEDVREFLQSVRPEIKYELVPIFDMFGPSGTDPNLQAIVVSYETLSGGRKVNEKRAENGICQLEVHVIDLISVTSESGEKTDVSLKVSSTDLRRIIHENPGSRPKRE